MSKYHKEVLLGLIPVLIVFLIFVGVEVVPLLFVCGVGALVLYMTRGSQVLDGFRKQRTTNQRTPSFLSFDQIGGQDKAKQELIEALEFLVHHEEAAKLGIRPLKGILLTGPPGTGKTLLAKAAAHYTDSVFTAASGSEFVEMYVGVGASRIREMFTEVKKRASKEHKANAIIFIDEIDVIGGKREGGQQKEYDQTLNQLLTEMDGMYANESPRIFVIAATNRKEMLDSALLRPGRFDRQIEIDLPHVQGRLSILKIHQQNKPLATDICLQQIAEQTYGFSGAQLEAVCNEAAIYALRDHQSQIEQRHMLLAIDKVLLGERTDRETSLEDKSRVAYHELGHAIAAEVLRPGSVSSVTITPRGKALGYVRHQPVKEQYVYTKVQVEQQMMIALAGATAEEMYYGGRSTGSTHDFLQVQQMARQLMDAGLTELGIIERDMVTKKHLMQVHQTMMDKLLMQTRQLLESHRASMQSAFVALMQEEVLSGEKFREMVQLTESHVAQVHG